MGESGLEIPNSQSLKEERRDASRFQLRMEIKFVVEVSIRDWLTMHLDSAFFTRLDTLDIRRMLDIVLQGRVRLVFRRVATNQVLDQRVFG
jgi:selenophosphate synthetase-related protein